MIAFLEGWVENIEPTFLTMNVNGVGYGVHITLPTYSTLKDLKEARVYTHFHVKEDSQQLYGFVTVAEKSIFQKLISVSGVGPSTALIMLSSMTVNDIYRSIVNGDVSKIQKVKGLGAKTSQRLILELKDKLKKEGLHVGKNEDLITVPQNTLQDEALSALIMLGYTKTAAEKSLQTVLKKAPEDISLEEVIKLALRNS